MNLMRSKAVLRNIGIALPSHKTSQMRLSVDPIRGNASFLCADYANGIGEVRSCKRMSGLG